MNKVIRALGIVAVIALVAASLPIHAKKEMKGQVSQNFVNESGEPAYGLHVQLSAKAMVVMSDDNRAGTFGNVQGNDSPQMSFSNPTEPIPLSESVELTFRSQNAKLKITTWWWTNAKGKRIGKKQKN